MDRRQFLGASSALASGSALAAGFPSPPGTPAEVAANEGYWETIARAFDLDRSLTNLNNGGVSPAPAHVQRAMLRHLAVSNQAPPYHIWEVLAPGLEAVRQQLARHLGVDAEEVALTRNASEGLMICQFGIDLQSGDQVLTTNQDYGRMLDTFRQRRRREGIEVAEISLPVPCEDDDTVVGRFAEAITDRTRMILCSHVINLTGQILPVGRICALGRERGIPFVVDGAHAVGHLDFDLGELGCDYYATSLHKWMFAPVGTGMLYVARDKIPGVWPLQAAAAGLTADIRKFEQVGTRPVAALLAVSEALAFLQTMQPARKLARLRHLRELWMAPLADLDRVRFLTSRDPRYSGGIGTFAIEGIDPADVRDHLFEKHRILTAAIHHREFRGLRVSPSVYTLPETLERFADAVTAIVRNGV